ncbi:MAG TPA: putative Ig domain-containing protein [Thermoanaerobaculia bacterium]|nr:putative Ig domain-containing protein [Thermoanaerobaculia bacterium]
MRKAVIAIVMFMAVTAIGGVAQAQCTLTNVTESLPGFFVGQPVNTEIEVCCGTAPYTFEIIDGALPDGLHMNSHGRITGVPRVEADTTVLVLITDSAGCSLGVTYPVRVMIAGAAADTGTER